ncbi:MAG TPA: SGNH/GDSL hydrolase family protein [Gemmatimonadaceae bacterium]|nr:SGNH/GDSL hydrolase family protein [Gemmatimonadaceae bacterium]
MKISREWQARILLLVTFGGLSLGLMVAAGEIAVRTRERNRNTPPGTLPLLFYRHARYGHALVRNYDYFGWVHVNNHGFRGREVTIDKPDSVFRIMIVGSSTTFDSGVTGDEKAWPQRLEHWLGSMRPDLHPQVINAGVPGYRVTDNLLRLQAELYRFQPDVLVFYEGHNDLFGSLRWTWELAQGQGGGTPERSGPWTPDEVPPITPWRHWLERHSLLYTKVAGRWEAIRSRARGRKMVAQRVVPKGDTATAPVRPTVDQVGMTSDRFHRDMDAFLAVAGSLGIPVVLPELVHVSGTGNVTEGDSIVRWMWERAVPHGSVETVLRTYTSFNDVLRALSSKRGATVIATAGFGLTGRHLYADEDPIHFNDAGADKMGRAMAQALLASGLLDSLNHARRATVEKSSSDMAYGAARP